MKAFNADKWRLLAQEHPLQERNASQSQGEGTEKLKQPWRGIMGGQYWEIALASSFLVLPMLVLSIVLTSLVYYHLMPDNSSSYSQGNATNLPLGSAYYINYSATRLVFIASASSTLSTILIGTAMILFSYLTAHYLAGRSDTDETGDLPSPYQLEILIRLLDARLIAMWSFLQYGLGAKGKRIPVIPDIWRAVSMLGILVLLTYLSPTDKARFIWD